MNEYEARGPYIATYRKYPELWRLLNQPDVIARMKMCSRLGKPAVMALEIDSEEIWDIFDDAVAAREFDDIKRMVGNMVRQIMESDNVAYELRSNGTSPVTSWLFSAGSRYKSADWVGPYYVHQPKAFVKPSRFCVSRARKLGEYSCSEMQASDWQYFRKINGQFELEFVLNRKLRQYGIDWDTLREEIRSDGFVILEN